MVSALEFSPDGMFVASAVGNHLSFHDPLNGTLWSRVSNAIPEENSILTALCFTGDKKLAVGNNYGSVALYDCRKLMQPLNIYDIANHQCIINLIYDSSTNWLISTDHGSSIQYHNASALEIKDAALERGLHFGTFLTCPSLSQIALQRMSNKLVICTKTAGSPLYVVDNVSVKHIPQDLKSVRFDDSLKIHLSLSPYISDFSRRRNRIVIIDQHEFAPEPPGMIISKFAQVKIISNVGILSKFTTKKRTLTNVEIKDWITCIKLNQQEVVSSTNFLSPYASNVLDDRLMFLSEEPRFFTLKEKKADISNCHRIIASPHSDGVQILAFNQDLKSIDDTLYLNEKYFHKAIDIFSSAGSSQTMTKVKLMDINKGYPVCCKFSPINNVCLAVGDSEGRVLLYQPHF
jgi:hypothetical protein